MMLVTGDHEGSVIYPVVVVVVNSIKCGALLDAGAGSSYASAVLVERLNKPSTHVEHKQILGASEYSRIKTKMKPRIGKPSEPIAQLTMLGWAMMSSGKETGLSNVNLTKSSSADYEQLCSLDVLGLEDRSETDQGSVYGEFIEQLHRSEKSWYESGLLWKPGHHRRLLTNKHGSIARPERLVMKLQRDPCMIDKYNEIIQEQLKEGIV